MKNMLVENTTMNFSQIIDLGHIPFPEAWKIQLDFVEKRAKEEVGDLLLLCEHDPVYTFGRNYKHDIPPLPFPCYKIERGGKATYHGPGQLVLYPICKLQPVRILPFIRDLEHLLIVFLEEYFGIKGEVHAGETGVWVGSRKIASIGIAVKKWVAFHGAALNIHPDLTHFFAIQPCGYSPFVMTSVLAETGRKVDLEEAKHWVFSMLQGNFVKVENSLLE
jgi:lipoyl(octanoyl) transferase